MYNGQVEKIKNQILTLAKGVSEEGKCPSAVRTDFSGYWGDHFDSPSFFVIMLYDYVKNQKDIGILNQDIDGITVYEKAVKVLSRLAQKEDKTSLIVKDGKFNKRDWADEVHRYGYVAYDEILYARANYSLSKLSSMLDKKDNEKFYLDKFFAIKNAINEHLWDEEKGYYVNFKNQDYVEDNLSIDTVLAVIFDIADSDRAMRLLKNMENLLEVKNNENIKLQDFGVMTVYPFYKNTESAIRKSLQPLNYHNGANWPYLSAMYAYAKRKYGLEYLSPLCGWFDYNVKRGNYTPIEYFSPACADGSLLQAWSGVCAFVLDEKLSKNFFEG